MLSLRYEPPDIHSKMCIATSIFRGNFLIVLFFLTQAVYLKGQFIVNRIGTSMIILETDTMNQYDAVGKRHGIWYDCRSWDHHFTSTIEDYFTDSGSMTSRFVIEPYLPERSECRIISTGRYDHGKKEGQWINYSADGYVEWIKYYKNGNLEQLLKLSAYGSIQMKGDRSQDTNEFLIERFDADGSVIRKEVVDPGIFD